MHHILYFQQGIRDQKCQPHQNSVNSNQKDCPTPVPDVRDHHWNEEERETGNKGDRKIEFPKHSHQHKKNSFIVTSEAQSTPPSGSSSHEAPSRGDRTGPSGRGLAYRPVMDSRPPAASSSYVPPDHDAAGKRRPPRQRQQAHSGCSTGRAKSPIKGFATGRGRPSAMQSETNGGLGMLRYSRGKLLDIYRKQRKSSSFDAAPEGFNRAPKNSQPNSIRPSPSVAPDSDGKVHGQVLCSRVAHFNGGEADFNRLMWLAGSSSRQDPWGNHFFRAISQAFGRGRWWWPADASIGPRAVEHDLNDFLGCCCSGEVRLGVKVTGGNNCQKIIGKIIFPLWSIKIILPELIFVIDHAKGGIFQRIIKKNLLNLMLE